MTENLKKDAKECFWLSAVFVLMSVFGFLFVRFLEPSVPKLITLMQTVMMFPLCCLSVIISIVLFGKGIWKLVKYKWQKRKETSPIVLGRPGSGKARSRIKVEMIDIEEEEE